MDRQGRLYVHHPTIGSRILIAENLDVIAGNHQYVIGDTHSDPVVVEIVQLLNGGVRRPILVDGDAVRSVTRAAT